MQLKINNGHNMPFCWLYFWLSACEQIPLVYKCNECCLHLHKYIFNIVRRLMLYCFQCLCTPKVLIRYEWIKVSLYVQWFLTLAHAFSFRKQLSKCFKLGMKTHGTMTFSDSESDTTRFFAFCSLLLIRFSSIVAYKQDNMSDGSQCTANPYHCHKLHA